MSTATKRAEIPAGDTSVLDRRTIHSNKILLDLVKPNHKVLDVGCGSGFITKGIAELVGKSGKVIGIDTSDHLINKAKENNPSDNLIFEVADINTYKSSEEFDVITAARLLQWLANPEEAIQKIMKLLKKGGSISILDYNHEKIQWSPQIPKSMFEFHQAFLKWRADAGMDNAIADHLHEIFKKVGLQNISVSDQSESSEYGSFDFYDEIGIWEKVAATRGKQLVADKYISESLRLKAIEDYKEWMDMKAESMKMNLMAVTGWK